MLLKNDLLLLLQTKSTDSHNSTPGKVKFQKAIDTLRALKFEGRAILLFITQQTIPETFYEAQGNAVDDIFVLGPNLQQFCLPGLYHRFEFAEEKEQQQQQQQQQQQHQQQQQQ